MDRQELLFPSKKHIRENDFKKGIDKECWIKILNLEKEEIQYTIYNVCNPEYSDSIKAEKIANWEYDQMFTDCTVSEFEDRVIDYINLVDRERSAEGLRYLAQKAIEGSLKNSQEIAGKVNELAMKIYKLHPPLSTGMAGEFVMEDLKELSETSKDGVDFGIRSIDKGLGKMNKGQFVLLAARPGTGKSSLFLYPLHEFCRLGKHVCLSTMEMTRAEMVLRILANRSNVMMDKIQGKIPSREPDGIAIADAIEEVKQWKLSIFEQGMNTPEQIDNFLNRCTAEHNPVELLILDHFGYLMPNSGKIYNRYSDYTTISNELKRLAKKHKCLILCLAQLNRISEYVKPSMENLRDTGSLEQDADKIIVMWRVEDDTRLIKIAIIKNRQGEEFETILKFYGSSMQFYDVEKE
jgi:replicative DNA helicase